MRKTPIFVRLPLARVTAENIPYVMLWRAFLDEMLFGAFGPRPDKECSDWLYERGDWDPAFETVADMAHLRPEWIRLVREKLEHGEVPTI